MLDLHWQCVSKVGCKYREHITPGTLKTRMNAHQQMAFYKIISKCSNLMGVTQREWGLMPQTVVKNPSPRCTHPCPRSSHFRRKGQWWQRTQSTLDGPRYHTQDSLPTVCVFTNGSSTSSHRVPGHTQAHPQAPTSLLCTVEGGAQLEAQGLVPRTKEGRVWSVIFSDRPTS